MHDIAPPSPRPLFSHPWPLLGVVHLGALPGSPLHASPLSDIEARALFETRLLVEGGFQGIILENFGDIPFFPETVEPHVVAAMTRIALRMKEVVERHAGLTRPRLGLNVLRNDARAALAIASMIEADFIRVNVHSGAMVTDQGVISGQAHLTLRYRQLLRSHVQILADVHVKHAIPLGNADLASSACDTWERGCVAGLIVSGSGTGRPVHKSDLETVVKAVPDAPVYVGSGLTEASLREIMQRAHGAIVGTALKKDGKVGEEIAAERVRSLVAARDRLLS